VEILSVAPQQHRMLSSVRRKLEMPDRSSTNSTSHESDTGVGVRFDMTMGTEEIVKGGGIEGAGTALSPPQPEQVFSLKTSVYLVIMYAAS